jgi:thiol-disulfide isomerase/thioredoxin
LLGTKPDADREVVFYSQRPDWMSRFHYIYDYYTHTDKQGRFRFDRVVPGPGSGDRVVAVPYDGGSHQAGGWRTSVEISPGKTTKIVIGGRGRPVTGRVKLPDNADAEVDWSINQPVVIEAWNKATSQRAETFAQFPAKLSESGRFEVPDVTAGDYKLTVLINNPPTPNVSVRGKEIGCAELEFSVPEMPGDRSDEPLDLGVIDAKLFFDTLKVGEVAPDFVAERLSGGSLKTSTLQGKLLLLDFWATWCAPCRAEMPNLQKLHEEFGKDPRFVLVGLSCDNDAGTAKHYVESNSFSWTQAFVGGTSGVVASAYTARNLPAIFLIAPDGRVLAKNLRGDELHKAVAAALADEKLFENADGRSVAVP